MKKLFLLLSALSVLNFAAEAQKSGKLTKIDKEFLAKQPDGLYAKFETNRGDIYALLDEKVAPMTVANFVGLAEGTMKNTAKAAGVPYYDGLKFHRVIPGFMIQGGCPLGNGGGDPGYSFEDELTLSSEVSSKGYPRGTIAMANRGPNTNGSQFFLMHKDYALPYNYTIFGKVVQGIEVVDSVAATPRNSGDLPLQDQTIRHLTILRKGKAAEAFDAVKVFETEKANVGVKAAAKAKADEAARATVNAEALKQFVNAKTTSSGLKYIMLQEGQGVSPKAGDKVTVFYSCKLTDGTVVDSNFGKEPVTFGLDQVIAGWSEGVQLIKPGGKVQLYVPYKLAWGDQPYGSIPAKSDVVFEIELVKVN